LQTLYPNSYACGDVAGPYQFTHTASHQAWYAAVNALFSPYKRFRADYSVIPWATFTDPEVARVGLNETEAKERGVEYESTSFDLAELDRAIADEAAHGFVKVLTAPRSDRILGATIVGGSPDDTVELAAPLCNQVVHAPRGRALQMNAGARVASGEALVFLHADTRLPERADEEIARALAQASWGRFDVRIASPRPLLALVA